jgi:TonB family protein
VEQKFNDSKQISEKYYVLNSDKTVKHGEYTSYFKLTDEELRAVKKGTIMMQVFIRQKGHYKNGKRDGLWIEYSQPNIIKTQGNYSADKKTGIWLTYKEKGVVTEKFDYDNNKKLQPDIKIIAEYPDSARDAGVNGNVTIRFTVHSDCSISEISITKSLTDNCDKAAIIAINRYSELLNKYGQDCQEDVVDIDLPFRLE